MISSESKFKIKKQHPERMRVSRKGPRAYIHLFACFRIRRKVPESAALSTDFDKKRIKYFSKIVVIIIALFSAIVNTL